MLGLILVMIGIRAGNELSQARDAATGSVLEVATTPCTHTHTQQAGRITCLRRLVYMSHAFFLMHLLLELPDALLADASCACLQEFLTVLDNFERAETAITTETEREEKIQSSYQVRYGYLTMH